MGGVRQARRQDRRAGAARVVGRCDGWRACRSAGSSSSCRPEASTQLRRAERLRRGRRSSPAARSARIRCAAGVAATDAEVVLVHDAARPLASPALADRVRRRRTRARRGGAGGARRRFAQACGRRPHRGRPSIGPALVRTQTPQGARRELLVAALDATARRVVHRRGGAAREPRRARSPSVAGEAANIKVTEPADLELVRALARRRGRRAARLRPGRPPFGPGLGLWLGGMHCPNAPRLYGHSDGDVVLHALATAVLSARGQGDLGRLFPRRTERTTRHRQRATLSGAAR